MKKLRIMIDRGTPTLGVWATLGNRIEDMPWKKDGEFYELINGSYYASDRTLTISFKKAWKIVSPALKAGYSIYLEFRKTDGRCLSIQPSKIDELKERELRLVAMKELMMLLIKARLA